MNTFTVTLDCEPFTITAQEGANLLHTLRQANAPVPAPCGGHGTCGKCRVIVVSGELPPHTPVELDYLNQSEREHGVRLACQIPVLGPMHLSLAMIDAKATIITDGGRVQEKFVPQLFRMDVQLTPPSLDDQSGDVQRLMTGLAQVCAMSNGAALGIEWQMMAAMAGSMGGMPGLMPTAPNLTLTRKLTRLLRENAWRVSVVHDGREILDITPPSTAPLLGFAVDIGTTTIAGYLIDLQTGAQLDVCSALNPQRHYGADVISRSDYASTPEGLETMQKLIVEEISKMADECARRQGFSSADIYRMTLVGNTVMMHLLAGLTTEHIAVLPFVPVYQKGWRVTARELGIAAHQACTVDLLPCVAGYVGADTVAAIISCGMEQAKEQCLLIDIGTNGEIALGNRDRILTCSAAAGPAFEGAHIRHGMGGVTGAISRVKIDGHVVCQTINDAPACGICGSGLVDAVAALLKTGVMDMMGRLQPPEDAALQKRMVEIEGKPAFMLVSQSEGAAENIVIYPKDLREVQLAKAAIAAGIRILVKEMDISINDIAHVYIAGGFGNYIDLDAACAIGLLPAELRRRIESIGNGAGAGAKMALHSGGTQQADEVLELIRYVELSSRPDFQDEFVEMLFFA